jgi:transcriptional regulator with XRE-family HTH domain
MLYFTEDKENTNMNEKRIRQFRELGLTISYYRKLKGLTQADLAQNVGLSRTHISNIEAPQVKTSISLESLFDIADALDVPVKDLFDFRN